MELFEFETLVRDAVNDVDLRPEEIPAIDLYVDQITSLTSDKLMQGSPRFRDRVLTKTMINNYSKDGLISPIKGKKYSKNHIMQMLLGYSLKNTLSIGEINRILQTVYAQPDYTPEMLEDTYSRFLDIMERKNTWSGFCDFLEKTELDLSNDTDYLTLILSLASASSYLKSVTQALLEAKYPEINPEKEQQEREEQKKQRKESKKESKKEKKEAKESKKDATGAKEQA